MSKGNGKTMGNLDIRKLVLDDGLKGGRNKEIFQSIVKGYHENGLEPLDVLQQASGEYLIIDGEQRFYAASILGLSTVRCNILPLVGQEAPPTPFAVNLVPVLPLSVRFPPVPAPTQAGATKDPSALDKFRDKEKQGDVEVREILRWLADNNFVLRQVYDKGVKDPRETRGLTCVAAFEKHWYEDQEACKKALLFQRSIGRGVITGDVFKGFWLLFSEETNITPFLSEFKRIGLTKIQKKIRGESKRRTGLIGRDGKRKKKAPASEIGAEVLLGLTTYSEHKKATT